MDTKLIVIPANELFNMLESVIENTENRKAEKEKERLQRETLYTINQVAHKLGRAHATIKKLVAEGVIKATPDGMISEKSVNDYLMNE